MLDQQNKLLDDILDAKIADPYLEKSVSVREKQISALHS
jgi:hypothetical protein